MKYRALLIPFLVFSYCKDVWATTVLASYGAYDRDAKRETFYMFEANSTANEFDDFELTLLNHVRGRPNPDSLEIISRGLGFDFEFLRPRLDIGYLFTFDKYALDEIDYNIPHAILGAGLDFNLPFLFLRAYSRTYVPSSSPETQIDSFKLSFNPYSYQQSQLGLSKKFDLIELQADAGRIDRLRGRYDILDESFVLKLPGINYGKLSVQIKGSHEMILRMEAHKILSKLNRRGDFQKLIGNAIHREAYDGGSLGIGISF